jgi:hypothetical protein
MTDQDRQLLAGLDLGSLSDHTAFPVFLKTRAAEPKRRVEAVPAEAVDEHGRLRYVPKLAGLAPKRSARDALWHYHLVMLKRWEADPKNPRFYEGVIDWLAKLYSREPEWGADGVLLPSGLAGTVLGIDETGVGTAVVGWLRKEFSLQGGRANVRPIQITGGRQATQNDRGGWNVPKRELVSVIQVLLGSGRLTIDPAVKLRGVLVEEFKNFKVKQDKDTGHESYEAWRESAHDDCVLGCAIILWIAERGSKSFWMKG